MQQDDNVDFYQPGDHKSDDSNLNQSPSPSSSSEGQRRSGRAMSWTAPEYIELQRGTSWYLGLVLIIAVITVALYFLSKDYFAIGSIIVVGITFAIFVSRKPQNIEYQLSDSGLEVGRKTYNLGQFKSFTIIREGGASSVEFLPLKRFALPVSALFTPEDEKQLVEIIGEHLPYTEHKPGLVDKLSQRLRL